MKTNNTPQIKTWVDIFKDFQQVDNVKADPSDGRLDITVRGRENILSATVKELDASLYLCNGCPHEVVTSFLKKHGILVYYQDTLVAFFDIQAYSTFLKKASAEKAIQKIDKFFSKIKNSTKTDMLAVKLDLWILSDSIILVVDTNRHPLFSGSLECFLGICSYIMQTSIKNGFPLRGAIGGGYFYKNGEVMVGSGLVDAAGYEKKQDWLGAVLTPEALKLVEKATELETKIKGKSSIDFSSDHYNAFVRYGNIPWKQEGAEIKEPCEWYYIKPFNMADKNWVSKYLPAYFDDQTKIKNSHCLYAEK